MALNPVQVRVLGALMEKEIATPESYPLSLNALIAACNQRSSRDPVMDLAEDEVRQALNWLSDQGLVSAVRDGRVAKYEHRVRTVWNLRRDETALLCLLFLRGPQTPGELRSRSDRLYSFDDLEAVQSTLERMASRPQSEANAEERGSGAGPLATVLPRQPGSREARWAHLLGGPMTAEANEPLSKVHVAGPGAAGQVESGERSINDRMSRLEAEIGDLRRAVSALEAAFAGMAVGKTSGRQGRTGSTWDAPGTE